MTILIVMALLVLAVVFGIFFLIFKVAWLIFKKHTNRGPLITAGICTVLFAGLVTAGIYKGYQAVLAPFKPVMARLTENPAPVYGPHTYADDTYPFELTVYDGMDFSNWITLGDVQLKLGMDTNALKKDAAGKTAEDVLFSVLLRYPQANEKDPFADLQTQLNSAQENRRLELSDLRSTEVNGLPAYQASGEAYSNRGKIYFWLTAVQTEPQTVYYVGAFALQDTDALAEKATQMGHSLRTVAQP